MNLEKPMSWKAHASSIAAEALGASQIYMEVKAMNEQKKIALSVTEAALSLGVSRATMYQYIKREDFPAARIGGRVLIPYDRLQAWLEAQAGARV